MPAVRQAEKDTLIVTDGFSCQEQIEQTTDRRALHLSQVLQMALRGGDASRGDYPEAGYLRDKPSRPGSREAALLGTGAALAGALAWELWRKTARRKQKR